MKTRKHMSLAARLMTGVALGALCAASGVAAAGAEELAPSEVAEAPVLEDPTAELGDQDSGIDESIPGVPLGSESNTRGTVIAVGCEGITHKPHRSAAFVSVHSWTQCKTGGDLKTVSVTLQMRQWWGWETKANGGASQTANSKADANAKWICQGAGTKNYVATAFHRVVRGGKNYTGESRSGEAQLYCN